MLGQLLSEVEVAWPTTIVDWLEFHLRYITYLMFVNVFDHAVQVILPEYTIMFFYIYIFYPKQSL